ncbi:MAG: RNA 2',3'-cyclic phosphodiesterase [Candidatus Dojkabacteria bacterium]|nr:MAG: RNA 2',3'-cyclic phosphodiesterase [Candidatus Dojkabacteria bacterium]
MRLFIAVFPPKEYLEYFRNVARLFNKQKRNLKFVPTDQLHITLKFLGNSVSENSYNIIRESLVENSHSFKPVNIELSDISFGFPKERFPKILLSKVKSTESLVGLSDEIHNLTQALKLKDTIRRKNRYANNFHVTLARLKDNAQKSTAKNIKSMTENINLQKPEPIEIDEFYIVESIINQKGVSYKKLDRFTLYR